MRLRKRHRLYDSPAHMVISSPFNAESTPLCVAAQSDRMYPWKPNSCFNQPFWARAFCRGERGRGRSVKCLPSCPISFLVPTYLTGITAIDKV